MTGWQKVEGDNVPKDEVVDFWVVRSDRAVVDSYYPMCAYLIDPFDSKSSGWFTLTDDGETEVSNADFFRVVSGPSPEDQEICHQQRMARKLDNQSDHKMVYSNWHEREAERLEVILALESAGFEVVKSREGLAELDGRWEIALRSMKWRNKGGAKWYRCKSAQELHQKLKGKQK